MNNINNILMSLSFGVFSCMMPAKGIPQAQPYCAVVKSSLSKYVRWLLNLIPICIYNWNNKIKFIVFALLSIVLSNSVHAQTLAEELKKVRNAYIINKQLSFDVEVYSYDSKTDKTASLVSKGYMKKNNDNYYSNFQNYELMIKGEKALMIDNQSKEMAYYEYKLSKQKMPENFQVNIDSLILNTDSIVMRSEKDGLKHFTGFSKSGYIKQTEIYADSKSYLVKRILYYYAPSTEEYEIDVDRVEIFYNNIKTQGVTESFFSFDRYFNTVKSALIPVGKYQGYKINFYKQSHQL